jgi:CRISPR-associated protein Cmr3
MTVEYIRPENKVGLLVEMEGYSWPQSGLLRLGGESRAASYTEVNANLAITTKPILNLPSRFKVYFATPTWFSDGWKPKDWKVFFDGEVILRAAALTRYQSIGGFDFSKKRHKPSRRFVPAGSVYYFECTGSAGIRSDLLQNALTEWGAEIGFGQYIISKEW